MGLYEVIGPDNKPRLIEAKTRAGARSFAAKDSISVDRVAPSRAHTLAARGVKIEKADGSEGGDTGGDAE